MNVNRQSVSVPSLVQEFPLTLIREDESYKHAMKILHELQAIENLDNEAFAYFIVLRALIADYEQFKWPSSNT